MGETPTRLAYVLTHHPRTTQTFIDAEIRALRAAGHEVVVFALNEPSEMELRSDEARSEQRTTIYLKRRALARVASAAIAVGRRRPHALIRAMVRALGSAGTDLRRMIRRLFHLGEALVVWNECQRREIGVLHAHFGQTPSTVAWLAAALAADVGEGPVDWVFTVHCASEVEDRAEVVIPRKVERARAIVAISDYGRSQLQRQLPQDRWDRIQVIRCGVDLDRLPYRSGTREMPSDVRTVLFVGRLDVAKGVPHLLAATRELRRRGMAIRLVIVGGGPLEAELRDDAADEEWIDLTGQLPADRVRMELERAHVFCLPSLDEGIPVSIMEAMAIGTPVVTTAVGGIPELAQDERTALVVAPGNAAALASALERVLTDAPLAERLRETARKRVEELHDSRRNLTQLIELLVPGSP